MSALSKRQRGADPAGQRQLWAVHVTDRARDRADSALHLMTAKSPKQPMLQTAPMAAFELSGFMHHLAESSFLTTETLFIEVEAVSL